MSIPVHPHLQERDQVRRRRRRRAGIGVGLMAALLLGVVIVLWTNAGRWGVPLFGFTNEYGSQCRNDWLGHHCSELTLADVERHVRVDLPPETRLLSGSWRQTHDYELTARLIFPQAVAREGWDRLTEEYGECRENVPSPLSAEPGLSGLCVMTNEGGFGLGEEPSPQLWRIATATQADGDTVVDLHIRSR